MPSPSMSRTTGASMVGAIFHVGARLGSGFTVANSRAMNSAGRKLAYRPHMPQDVVRTGARANRQQGRTRNAGGGAAFGGRQRYSSTDPGVAAGAPDSCPATGFYNLFWQGLGRDLGSRQGCDRPSGYQRRDLMGLRGRVDVRGYVDTSMSKAKSNALSERMAKAVRDELVRDGIDAEKLEL